MQKAIEKFIDEEMVKEVPFDEISNDIDKVRKTEIQKAKERQRRQWRKLNR